MQCHQEKASDYLSALFTLKRKISEGSQSASNEIWLSAYSETIEKGYELSNLPQLLALIHPDFYYRDGEPLTASLLWSKGPEFTAGITKTDRCRAKEYTGVDCIFNTMSQIRGRCHADHSWPNSLGGPSILDNRLLLCRFHNGMKSNDVSHYSWGQMPNWLEAYLGKIYRLKL